MLILHITTFLTNNIIKINIMVINAKILLFTVSIENCSDFRIYVINALGKFTKYATTKLLSDNL